MAAGFDRYSQVMQDIELHEGLRCTGAALVYQAHVPCCWRYCAGNFFEVFLLAWHVFF